MREKVSELVALHDRVVESQRCVDVTRRALEFDRDSLMLKIREIEQLGAASDWGARLNDKEAQFLAKVATVLKGNNGDPEAA
mmetsp:Transcript_39128/g.91740  ORF Transcript_39128/g.91740 Transcript_39128/m.91740 type:complete len:82 (+) Transcript_39128:43-288(+)